MPTSLDERPQRRAPVLYGRALVEQQKAEQQAREHAIDDFRQQNAQQETARHNRAQEALVVEAQKIAQMKQSLEIELKLKDLQKEREQLTAFTSAQRQIGKLKPDDPNLSEQIAEIQAQHNILFDGKSPFASALGNQVQDLFTRRKAVETAAETKAKAEAGRAAAAAAGMTASSFTDPTNGVTMRAEKPVEKKVDHEMQKLFLQDYHSVEQQLLKEKGAKKPVESNINLLSERRKKAMENLAGVGIILQGGAPVVAADEAVATAPLTPTPDAAPLDREALAKAAIEDPLATEEHKSAARKILGYQDEVK